ncbi:MAG: hypothetical protein ABIP30_15625 [Ferruginibacter sp.]
MLTKISWTEYLVTIAILLIIYYAFVLMLFYKQDILLLVTGRSRRILPHTERDLQNINLAEGIEPLADELKGGCAKLLLDIPIKSQRMGKNILNP